MSEKDIEVVFVGDSYVQRPDPDSAFAHVGDYLRAEDIAFLIWRPLLPTRSIWCRNIAVEARGQTSGCSRPTFARESKS